MGRASFVFVSLGFVIVAACNKSAAKGPVAPVEEGPDPAAAAALVKLEEFRGQGCECKDVQCSLAVAGERNAWLVAEHGKYKFTAEQQAAADETNAAYATCVKQNPTESEQAMQALRALRDRVCACKDKACAEKVMEDLMEMAEKYKDFEPEQDQLEEATRMGQELTTCMEKAIK
jgi:hypothetical protein